MAKLPNSYNRLPMKSIQQFSLIVPIDTNIHLEFNKMPNKLYKHNELISMHSHS